MNHLTNLRAALSAHGVDALLVLDELNQHYLSGFAFTDGFLLITRGGAYLVTDFRYYENAGKHAYPDFEVVMSEDRAAFIDEELAVAGARTVGFEGGSVSYETYLSYKKAHSAIEFVDIGSLVEELRKLKTPEELEKMQKAQDITDLAFSHIVKVLTPKMTEIEVAAELEYVMRKNGANGFAFDTIAVSGDASALPHGTPRNVPLKKGFLTMDYGAKFEGYCSDMTRTVVIGRADEEIKKVYHTVLRAQTEAMAYLKEGADCGEADKIARDIIDASYPGTFGHSLGHSVGLYIHESPRLYSRGFGKKLRVGEIVTVEPGIYLFGKYGCRIEDMVAVEKRGVHDFTHSSKELIEIL